VATGPVVAENTQGDRDGDGIPDSLDRCPDQPGDTDADGCPEVTPAERKVLVSGGELQVLSAISFARGSDALAPEATPILDQVEALLKSHKEITRVGVAGHASAEEKDPEGLSARRAAAVRLALQQRGVTTELVPRAYGATRPLDTGGTDAARAHNRRT